MWCTFWCTICIKNLYHFCPKPIRSLLHIVCLFHLFLHIFFLCLVVRKMPFGNIAVGCWGCHTWYLFGLFAKSYTAKPSTKKKWRKNIYLSHFWFSLFFPTRQNSVFLSFLFVDFSVVLLCVCCLLVFKRIDECLNSTFELFSQFTVTDPLGFLFFLLLVHVVCVIRTQCILLGIHAFQRHWIGFYTAHTICDYTFFSSFFLSFFSFDARLSAFSLVILIMLRFQFAVDGWLPLFSFCRHVLRSFYYDMLVCFSNIGWKCCVKNDV